jgi:beta-fructofuranosidase
MSVKTKFLPLAALLAGSAVVGPASATDKTLVAWVAPANLDQQGGSALTIQAGAQFDAIVFGERARGKWMAGSDSFSRTQKNQNANAAETAGTDALVQLAIVYQGNTIRLCRNGEVYAEYTAQNADLLNAENHIAVFGLRHIGASSGTPFAGAIEDARIYGRALTAQEVQSLKPNAASDTPPLAWWDFEGQTVKDRAGRFSHHALLQGATIKDGKLLLDGKGYLVAARSEATLKAACAQPAAGGNKGPDIIAMPENPPATWLTYHLAHSGPSGAVPADPNPAFFYKGRYHLHYIYNFNGPAFAHVSSTDMVHWKWHPTTLSRGTTGHGMFSGTGFFSKEGTPVMIYHGQGSGRNYLAFGLDDLLESWSRPVAIEPLTATGEKPEMRHWDPDCWLMNDTYYALSGGSNPQLMKSSDLKQWLYLGDLLHPDFPATLGVQKGEDISCANMFKIGNPSKWMLLCISHGLGARYYLGDFKDEKYLPEHHALLNWARWDFFAPETFLAQDGRRIMIAWCTPWVNGMQKTNRAKNFNTLMNKSFFQQGIQSLPRELSLPADGILRIKPIRELEQLRADKSESKNLTVTRDTTLLLPEISGDSLELEVVMSAPSAQAFGINLLCDAKGENGFTIASGAGSTNLTVGYIQPPFTLKEGEDLTLRIFIDKSMIEVFANERQAAVAWHEYAPENLQVSLFAKGGDLLVKKVTAWKMKSAYTGDCRFTQRKK